jgi:CheY-like chemotaxis protein
MPEMDGFEATRLIRDPGSAVRNHGIPIVAMTAHAMKGDEARCRQAGMDAYVAKPVKTDELREVIDRQLATASGAPAGQGAGGACGQPAT